MPDDHRALSTFPVGNSCAVGTQALCKVGAEGWKFEFELLLTVWLRASPLSAESSLQPVEMLLRKKSRRTAVTKPIAVARFHTANVWQPHRGLSGSGLGTPNVLSCTVSSWQTLVVPT